MQYLQALLDLFVSSLPYILYHYVKQATVQQRSDHKLFVAAKSCHSRKKGNSEMAKFFNFLFSNTK